MLQPSRPWLLGRASAGRQWRAAIASLGLGQQELSGSQAAPGPAQLEQRCARHTAAAQPAVLGSPASERPLSFPGAAVPDAPTGGGPGTQPPQQQEQRASARQAPGPSGSSGSNSSGGGGGGGEAMQAVPLARAPPPPPPPWLTLSPEEQQERLAAARQQRHHSPLCSARAAIHPASTVASIPFVGVLYALPHTVPQLPPAHFFDPGAEHLRRKAQEFRQRPAQQLESAALSAAAKAAERAAARAEAEAERLAEARASAALQAVAAAAKRLQQLRQSGQQGCAAGAAELSAAVALAAGATARARRRPRRQQQQQAQQAEASVGSRPKPKPARAAGRRAPPSKYLVPALQPLFDSMYHDQLNGVLARVDACCSCTRNGEFSRYYISPLLRHDGVWEGPSAENASAIAKLLLQHRQRDPAQEAGATPADVLAALTANPWLLGASSAVASANVGILRSQGFSAQPAAPTQPGEWEGQGSAAGRRGWWRARVAAGGSSRLGRLVTRRPQLLLIPGEARLLPLLQFLSRLGLALEQQERVLKQDRPLLSEGGLPQARAVVAFLNGKLLTREEVAHIVGRAPKVLVFSPASLALKWFYMEEGLGGSGRDVVASPGFLTARLETVGARVALAESLGVPMLLPSKHVPDGRMVVMSTAAAARCGRDNLDGVSLSVLVHDTDKKFAARLGVPLEDVQESARRFKAGDWQAVLEGLGG